MARSPLRIASALTVETRDGTLAGARWIELLAAVDRTQSISAAAKAVNLSYKAAWDAVDAMNNLADQPLVERSVGGKGGGGTRLTLRGRQLVETFRTVERENQRFLQELNASLRKIDRKDLQLIGRLGMKTSARNQYAGRVLELKRGSVNDEVVLELSGGQRITAVVTHESAENLGLAVGADAVALIKASWVLVALAAPGLKVSARNQLPGRVRRVVAGAVNSEVVIELAGGLSVAAVVTNEAVQELQLAEGVDAVALFKASSVILGVAG